MVVKSTILATLLAASASAFTVPSNIQTFYNNVKGGGCKSFAGGKSNLNDGQGKSGFGFCTDTANVVYLSGKNSLGDMDVDCDGAQNCGGLSGDFQSGTTFDDILKSKYGIKTLDASIHQFSVLGTCSLDLSKTIQPLALVAVVCNNQLFYSVWGDTNGCDDDNFTGEASISLAQMCFPNEGLNGNKGHEAHDVLYLAFTGSDAVPGPNNANWKAKSASEFQQSLKAFGDSVLAKKFGSTIPPSNSNPPPPVSTGGGGGGSGTCSWAGHCAGATCASSDDCDGDLECKNGTCGGGVPNSGGATQPGKCSWAGHCAGDKCSSADDCDGDLECKSGVCGGSGSGGSNPPPPASTTVPCSWAGHCAGASCSSDDDCADSLECKSGRCSS